MPEVIIISPTTDATTQIVDLKKHPDEVTFSAFGPLDSGESIVFQRQNPDLSWRDIQNNSIIQALTPGDTDLTTVSKLEMRLSKSATTAAVGVKLTW
jgi:hypothetical protein